MGCASSTPMIQTSGSEMLKAATHVATDATKTAEDTVEGIKDSVGKTLETAKESVTTTVDSVKHEVENVVKEKSDMLEDAKNSLLEKLHLKQNETESTKENANNDTEKLDKTETDELKTQLNASLEHNDVAAKSNLIETAAMQEEIKDHVSTAIDTETDSLKTSTPEPEIEQALAKSHGNPEDEDDNPPTPKPTLSELENLTAELLKQQQQTETTTIVNDINMSNDPLMSVMHANIKNLDNNNMMMSLTADNNTIKDNETTTTTIATATATALTINDIKSNTVHTISSAPQIVAAVGAKPSLAQNPQPLLPLALTTTAIAAVTATAAAQSKVTNEKEKFHTPSAAAPTLTTQTPKSPPCSSSIHQSVTGRLERIKGSNGNKDKVLKTKEKRPRTTEWEKFADMLAQMRKFNPHGAYRRGGTLTKFGGGGCVGQLRERSVVGHHMRYTIEDDSSDSPLNSQRSSARAFGRVQRLSNRPNTGQNRRHNPELSTHNSGGNYALKPRRNSNISSIIGRKFDFNPTRSRLNEFVSSTPLIQSALDTSVATQMPCTPFFLLNASVKSPANMRPQHSRNKAKPLPPVETLERTRAHSQQVSIAQPQHRHYSHAQQQLEHDYDLYHSETSILTRHSSNTSLFSNISYVDNLENFKSSTPDMRLLPTSQAPVKNSSSFLTTPRCSPFSLRKSYTDLYFTSTSYKENKPNASSELFSRDRSPFKARRNLNVRSKN